MVFSIKWLRSPTQVLLFPNLSKQKRHGHLQRVFEGTVVKLNDLLYSPRCRKIQVCLSTFWGWGSYTFEFGTAMGKVVIRGKKDDCRRIQKIKSWSGTHWRREEKSQSIIVIFHRRRINILAFVEDAFLSGLSSWASETSGTSVNWYK